MNFTKEEVKRIKNEFSFVKKIKTIEVLKYLKITWFKDHIEITGTDLELTAILTLDKKVDPFNTFLIPYNLFDKESIEITDNKVKSGNMVSEFVVQPVEDFPPLNFGSSEYLISFNEKEIDLIKQSLFATSTDKLREILWHVKIEAKDNEVKAITTDGYRMPVISFTKQDKNDVDLVFPKRLIEKMQLFANFYVNDNFISLVCGDATYYHKKIDGTFPNWQRVYNEINDNLKGNLVFNTKELKDAVSSFPKSIIRKKRSEETKTVTKILFDVDADKKLCTLSFELIDEFNDSNTKRYESTISCQATENFKTCLNREYVLDILNLPSSTTDTMINYINSDKAVLINYPNISCVLMPIRFNKE